MNTIYIQVGDMNSAINVQVYQSNLRMRRRRREENVMRMMAWLLFINGSHLTLKVLITTIDTFGHF